MARHRTADLQKMTHQQLAATPVTDGLVTKGETITLRDIVDSSVAGSTNDATLRFNSANDTNGDLWDATARTGTYEVSHSATAGDSVTIHKRGLYAAVFCLSQAPSSTVKLGLSADVAAGGLTGDPVMTIAGMLDVGGGVLPAATNAYHKLAGLISVTGAQEEGAGVVVRAHGTNGAGAVIPNATIDANTECFLKIVKVADAPI